MRRVFEPVKIGNLELKNRLVRSATWEGIAQPDDMTEDEIHLVVRQFIDAAVRAKKAGFDGVQIHGAHVNEGCFVPAAAAVAEAVSCPVMVVGGFRGRDKA